MLGPSRITNYLQRVPRIYEACEPLCRNGPRHCYIDVAASSKHKSITAPSARTQQFHQPGICYVRFVLEVLSLLYPSMKRIQALFSACLPFFCVKLHLELVRVTQKTSRHRRRRHPRRRGLAQIDRLRAGDRYSWSYSYDNEYQYQI